MGKQRVAEQAETITIPDDALLYMRWIQEDLTCRQAAVMAIVEDNPGVTVGAVAAVLGVPKPSVTRAVDRLEEFLLLHRTHNAEDRRLVALYAGKKAKQPAPARMGRSTRGGG